MAMRHPLVYVLSIAHHLSAYCLLTQYMLMLLILILFALSQFLFLILIRILLITTHFPIFPFQQLILLPYFLTIILFLVIFKPNNSLVIHALFYYLLVFHILTMIIANLLYFLIAFLLAPLF